MDTFQIEVAGIPIVIQSRDPDCRLFYRDYLSDGGEAAFTVRAQADLLEEFRAYSPGDTEDAVERNALYSLTASRLPLYGRVLLHGACISYRDRAYFFAAPSGTGKTTHIALWARYIGSEVDIVNGDKPLFSVRETEGHTVVWVHGTPWCGKERWGKNVTLPVAGICFLRRGAPGENQITTLAPEETIDRFLIQMYPPRSAEAMACSLELADRILQGTSLYSLACDMSEDAVRCSFEAMTGETYPDRGIQISGEELDRRWRTMA